MTTKPKTAEETKAEAVAFIDLAIAKSKVCICQGTK